MMDGSKILNTHILLFEKCKLTIVIELLLEVVGRNPYTTCANSTNADHDNYV